MKSETIRPGLNPQVSRSIDLEIIDPFELQVNRGRIRTWSEDEIVFQFLVPAVINHVYPGINLGETHPRKGWHVAAPGRRIGAR
jgi:hypothetical protein